MEKQMKGFYFSALMTSTTSLRCGPYGCRAKQVNICTLYAVTIYLYIHINYLQFYLSSCPFKSITPSKNPSILRTGYQQQTTSDGSTTPEYNAGNC